MLSTLPRTGEEEKRVRAGQLGGMAQPRASPADVVASVRSSTAFTAVDVGESTAVRKAAMHQPVADATAGSGARGAVEPEGGHGSRTPGEMAQSSAVSSAMADVLELNEDNVDAVVAEVFAVCRSFPQIFYAQYLATD